mgnify:FL=1
MKVEEAVKKSLEKMQGSPIGQVYLIACGGSLNAMYPAKLFLETESKKGIKVGYYTSNEFVHNLPKSLCAENSLAIISSHLGETPESVEAARICQEAGVQTICFTDVKDSSLAKYSDYIIDYTSGDVRDVCHDKITLGLKLAAELLNETEGYEHYDEFIESWEKIDSIVKRAQKQVEERAERFAEKHKDSPIIYTLGSGTGYSSAYAQSLCIFMEMQWMNSAAYHTGEFFHGPFEITDRNTPFMLFISEGATRPLDERARKFLEKYAEDVEILDAKELGLSILGEHVSTYFNFSLFNNVLIIYNNAIAKVRNHPLSVRRYMWKVEY